MMYIMCIYREIFLFVMKYEGWTALMRAAAEGHLEVTTRLIKSGASMKFADEVRI